MMIFGFVLLLAGVAMQYAEVPRKSKLSEKQLWIAQSKVDKLRKNYIWPMLAGLAVMFLSTII